MLHWKSITIGALCFAAGGISGVMLSSNAPAEKPTNQTPALPTKDKQRFGLNWTNTTSGSGSAGKPTRSSSGDGLVTVPLSLLESMSLAKSTRSIHQAIVDDNDPIDQAMGLTYTEKQRIQNDWKRASDKLREAEVRAMTSEDLEDGSVLIKVPNLSRERKEIAEEFKSALAKTLGDERGEAFYATKQIQHVIAADAGERKIAVKVDSVGDNLWSYRMTLTDATGEERVWVGESIPHEIRHLGDAAGIFPTIDEAVSEK